MRYASGQTGDARWGMPWKATDAMKERTKFVLEWERRVEETRDQVNLAELCREFGVSRPTGYRWIDRYVGGGCDVRKLEERSRRPRHSPAAVSPAMVYFGPIKLGALDEQRLDRGLVVARRRRRALSRPVTDSPTATLSLLEDSP